MDTVTQFVIGAAAGQLVGGRALGRKAALVGGLAGWLPDADVLIRSAADPLLAIEQHRGFTHALLFTPVGAAVVAAPFLLHRAGRAKAGAVYAAALAGWATHAPLDACTSYGTQLLWPLSDLRVAWNVVSIVDPMITLPLILGVVLAAWLRRAWPAAAALAVALAWIGVGAIQHARAADAQQALADARGHQVVRALVDPSLGNMVVWRSLYQTPDGRLHADAIRLPLAGGPVTVRQGASTPVVGAEEIESLPAASPEAMARAARVWFWFTDGWVGRLPGAGVVLADHRYAADPAGLEPLWAMTLRPQDAAAPVSRSSPRLGGRGMIDLWREVVGQDRRHVPLPAVEQRPGETAPRAARERADEARGSERTGPTWRRCSARRVRRRRAAAGSGAPPTRPRRGPRAG
ncbi:MAG: metal-dependent hydrolase [Anaeromyxobacteraceae bacterium]